MFVALTSVRRIQLRVVNGNYDSEPVDVKIGTSWRVVKGKRKNVHKKKKKKTAFGAGGTVLFSNVTSMESTGFKTPYKRVPTPGDGALLLEVVRRRDDVLLGKKKLDGVVDGVWHTIMFAARGDQFCAALVPDTGRTAPRSLPAEGKAMLVAYNVGCGLTGDKVLSVLLNGVVIWPEVPIMSQTRALQFAAGSYAYDIVLADPRGGQNASGDGSSAPILAAGNGGVDFVGRFNSTAFYRMYIGRIGSSMVAPIVQIEKTADVSRPLPADVQVEDKGVVGSFASRAEVWFVENSALAGIIIGVAAIVCCACCIGIVLLMRRKKRNSRDWD